MKRFLSIILACVFFAVMIAGCSSSNKTANESTSEQKQETSKEESKEELKEEVKIYAMHHMTSPVKMKTWDNVVAAFNTKKPEIKVESQNFEYANYMPTLKAKIAAGDAPDLIFGTPRERGIDLINSGQIADLTSYNLLGELTESNANAMKINGKVYGVPLDVSALGMFYNKDIFKNAGVEVPKTFSDFIKVCETLKSKGIIPIGVNSKDQYVTRAVIWMPDWYGAPLKNNPTFFEDIMSGKKKISDFPEWKASLERQKKIMDYCDPDRYNVDLATVTNNFATGKYAMWAYGSWATGSVMEINPKGNFGFFAIPTYDEADKNLLFVSPDDCWMVSEQSKVKDACAELLRFVASKEAALIWGKGIGPCPVVKDAGIQWDNDMQKDIQAILDSGKVFNSHEVVNPTGEYFTELSNTFEEFYADKNRSVEDTIKKQEQAIEKINKLK